MVQEQLITSQYHTMSDFIKVLEKYWKNNAVYLILYATHHNTLMP